MIGYIRPWEPELRIREFRYYRGVYCGLCHAMGKCTGQCSRLTLSYDLTFYALVRLAFENGNPEVNGAERKVTFVRRRCLLHPFRASAVLEYGRVLEDAACASAILSAYRMADDRADERGMRRWRARLLTPPVAMFHRRAARRREAMDDDARADMAEFGLREKESPASADRPADAFGKVMGDLFADGYEENRRQIAYHIGFHLGRWLYLLDAADDYDADRRAGRYNALRGLYGEDAVLDCTRRQDLLAALTLELRRAADALDLWEWDDSRCGVELRAILYHMLTVALPRKTKEVLFPTHDPKKKHMGRRKGIGSDDIGETEPISTDAGPEESGMPAGQSPGDSGADKSGADDVAGARTQDKNDGKERRYQHDGSI